GLDPDDWALEPVWTCIDYYSKLQQAIPGAPASSPWPTAAPEIKKALLDVYGSRCDQAANALPLNSSYTLGRLLGKELAAGDTLVSFNYDTLAERLATRFGHTLRLASSLSDLDLSFDPSGILFAKPHGSASWAMHLSTNTITCSNDYSPILDSLSAADV